MNEYLREILSHRIKKTLADSRTAIKIDHPGLTGELREIFLEQLINPLLCDLLCDRYSTGTGKLIDFEGRQSKQTDICIYNRNLLPPLFFSSRNKVALFPIESVLNCIEIKSRLSASTLKEAYENFLYLNNTLIHTSGLHDENEEPVNYYFVKAKLDVFAYAMETTKYTAELILNIYSKIDPKWDTEPLITSICVAGKGWVCYTARGWYHMSFDKKNNINEEVIGYLCCLCQSLPGIELSRGIPRIGYYLTNSYSMDKIKGGKRIKNTWRNKKIIFSNSGLDVP
jgi:hypothetical protein